VFKFQEFYIPQRMEDGIKNYIVHKIPPGHFLTAIIQNDLKSAVERADDENLRNIPAYVAYFYNLAPHACWGSPEKMKLWLKRDLEKEVNQFEKTNHNHN